MVGASCAQLWRAEAVAVADGPFCCLVVLQGRPLHRGLAGGAITVDMVVRKKKKKKKKKKESGGVA
eukprot:NODE_21532_length_749_cov_1.700965.p3 GENE.NODE_21532_length_749_cov_1.700965~~NODE_21532_length_749_cov_1.700965.p3  ORF type:complete len:66 (-),score=24.72 NODE_21532_length_749_cov_1.700965:152-349(-)